MSKIYFTDDHEYIIVDGDTGTVGISEYAQKQLGDVVYVELPQPGKVLQQKDEAAVVESVKVASEVYAPVGGEVLAVNEDLAANPALINEDAHARGWFFRMKIRDAQELLSLKDAEAYKAYVETLS